MTDRSHSLPPLAVDDFAAFFEEVHGVSPFPWQRRLLEWIVTRGEWPPLLDLPTGAGKTASIDVSVFHLALEAGLGKARRAPVRIAMVIDRRLVVDDAHRRAQKIANALADPPGPICLQVAARLACLAEDGNPPLVVRRLRGGIPREDDWARTPSQPTVLCSTVDQVGSRLLFRGYGVSDAMKPVHAGLIGADCLILLDEAHLAEPFRQTLEWVRRYHDGDWHDPTFCQPAPWYFVLLSATPGEKARAAITFEDDDLANETLAARWKASKPAQLVALGKSKAGEEETDDAGGDEADAEEADRKQRIPAIVEEARRALKTLQVDNSVNPALGVVVNRVISAREVFERLQAEFGETVDLTLLIGPARPVDKDKAAELILRPIRTGENRALPKPLVIVATQCIEAGIDIDLDGLVTEAAPLDALRQRFGRVNRAGRKIEAYGAIVAMKSDLSPRYDDPVYGKAIKATWAWLESVADKPAGKNARPIVDFGLEAFENKLAGHPLPGDEVLSPKTDAPVLMPAHLDLFSQTAPVPAADPEAALYLHGPNRAPASVTVIWRADVDPAYPENTRRLLMLVPPRTGEAIELPLWAVQAWLERRSGALPGRLADIAERASEGAERSFREAIGPVFRWAGDDERSAWIRPGEIRAGDTIIVPAGYGGADRHGWNPRLADPVSDVAAEAAEAFAGRHFAVRVAPGLLMNAADADAHENPGDAGKHKAAQAESQAAALASMLAQMRGTRRWTDLREALDDLELPGALKRALGLGVSDNETGNSLSLNDARGGKVEFDLTLYGEDEEGRPRGVVFVALRGLKGRKRGEVASPAATEDDLAGSIPGFPQPLDEHCRQVAAMAETFARRAGLPEDRVADLKLAGELHDLGKADPRFQAWLHSGDPLGPDPDRPDQLLAKSGRSLPRDARQKANLPFGWRHEALSVRLAMLYPKFPSASDRDLILWLIGTHHGQGRPLFPHADPLDREDRTDLPRLPGLPPLLPAGCGPQSLAFDWQGLDWPGLYERLKARYGVWELARMEAVLRLADHRASEKAAAETGERAGGAHVPKGDAG